MSKQITHTIRVEFGDCDPARIVWFPNFFRWIDAASRHFFVQCGVPSWQETEKTMGVIGTPLVDTHARFVKTASYGDTLDIHTTWPSGARRASCSATASCAADEDLIMECDEVRIFAGAPGRRQGHTRHPDPGRHQGLVQLNRKAA